MSQEELDKSLKDFGKEFGRILDPVAFLKETSPELCASFLKIHELTVNDGTIPKKYKFLIHAAITAAQQDRETTAMHLTGDIKAGASEQELRETAFSTIPVAGMPSFACFLAAWQNLQPARVK